MTITTVVTTVINVIITVAAGSWVLSGFGLWELSQVGIEEAPQEALDGRLGRAQGGIRGQARYLRRAQSGRAALRRVETFDGAGQPEESLQTLDVAAAVVHQLVFGHRPAAAVREEQEPLSWYQHQHANANANAAHINNNMLYTLRPFLGWRAGTRSVEVGIFPPEQH